MYRLNDVLFSIFVLTPRLEQKKKAYKINRKFPTYVAGFFVPT